MFASVDYNNHKLYQLKKNLPSTEALYYNIGIIIRYKSI